MAPGRDNHHYDRASQDINVKPILFQSGADRGKCPMDETPQTMRLNLTAFSQVYNLYFLAQADEVHVFQPVFPEQRISDNPDLIINLPISRPGLRGYIVESIPHAVNNILVDFLGEEEILVVCCDDGDVIGIYVNAIVAELNQKNEIATGILSFSPTPFLHTNVEKSAWGLSVHRKARKIAISANTAKVTIIEFALAEDPTSPLKAFPDSLDEGNVSDQYPELQTSKTSRKDERRYQTFGMDDNLPCVSFCNTGEDPTGRWLLCSNIKGRVFLWDLEWKDAASGTAVPRQAWTLSMHVCISARESTRCNCPNFSHMTWKASWLEPQAFQKSPSIENAIGCAPTPYPLEDCALFDGSHSREELSDWTPMFADPSFAHHQELSPNPSTLEGPLDTFATVEFESEEEESETESNSDEHGEEDGGPAVAEEGSPDADVSNVDETDSVADSNGDDTSENETTDEDDAFDTPNTFLNRSVGPVFSHSGSIPADMPRSPILIVNNEQLYVLDVTEPRSTNGREVAWPRLRATLFDQPLTQLLPPPYPHNYQIHFLSRSNRMNMFCELPELGTLVAGSGVGRVVVSTLTHFAGDPPSREPSEQGGLGSLYTFRLEYILPFASQEQKRHRPGEFLVGVAASPIQGTLNHDASGSRRRYRLLLYYRNHTVLAYELSREVEKGNRLSIVESLVI